MENLYNIQKREDNVNINLDEYNELRDFKKGINENYFVLSHPNWFGGGAERIDYKTKEETVLGLSNEINILKKEVYDLKNPVETIEVIDFYEMSLWQIIKWKIKS